MNTLKNVVNYEITQPFTIHICLVTRKSLYSTKCVSLLLVIPLEKTFINNSLLGNGTESD